MVVTLLGEGWAEPDFSGAPMLGQREVLCSLVFSQGSYALTSEHKRVLDVIGSRMSALAQDDSRVLRVEGFASPEGEKEANVGLSFARARVVEEYLLATHAVDSRRFLTGFGAISLDGVDPEDARKVEVVKYSNRVDMEQLPIDIQTSLPQGGRR